MDVTGDNVGGWDYETDIVVIGYGYAGGVSAIEASDLGCSVLLLEKMPDPGGISICSGGNVRAAEDANEAFTYLKETCAGTTPDDVLQALAIGMTEITGYFEHLAKASGAEVEYRRHAGNYPFPGTETFGYTSISSVPGFDAEARYPHVNSYVPIHRAAGVRLFKVLEDNIEQRDITIWLESAAQRLITGSSGQVLGLTIDNKEGSKRVKARKGVILACGGFEANPDLQLQHWPEKPVLLAAFQGSTGDGIRMAQDAGASLWHMWSYHGVYGFRHPDPDYPYGLRPKRLPDWVPGKPAREGVKMPWIVVDRNGQRYMNEYPPYMQDTSARPMAHYDPQTQSYPRIPSYIVLDDPARWRWPLCSPTFNDRGFSFDYSEESLRALEERILTKAYTLGELASSMNVEETVLVETVGHWNSMCDRGRDDDFGRPGTSMTKIETPPFYLAEVWPVCSNTHGGPAHNKHQQVLDAFGEPIPRLYAAGELGGVFGHLYLGGGNMAECFVGGWTAARHAASLRAWV